jgi:hypothetical protein
MAVTNAVQFRQHLAGSFFNWAEIQYSLVRCSLQMQLFNAFDMS